MIRYHELVSLVAFAEAGDLVELEPGMPLGLSVDGPFADALSGDNLILGAAGPRRRLSPASSSGAFGWSKSSPSLRVSAEAPPTLLPHSVSSPAPMAASSARPTALRSPSRSAQT